VTRFHIDDDFAFHQKTVQAGNAAIGLWSRAGSWSAWQLTDGLIPAAIAKTLGTPAEAKRLVEVGLWARTEGGDFQFVNWAKGGRNQTKDEVLAQRERNAEKVAKWRGKQSDTQVGNRSRNRVTPKSLPGLETEGVTGSPTPHLKTAPNGAAPSSENSLAQDLARAYCDIQKLSNFPAVMGVAKKAIQSGRYGGEQIRDALVRLATAGRSVTVDALRYELDGFPATGQTSRRLTVLDGLEGS
jgi:hypothetical protein